MNDFIYFDIFIALNLWRWCQNSWMFCLLEITREISEAHTSTCAPRIQLIISTKTSKNLFQNSVLNWIFQGLVVTLTHTWSTIIICNAATITLLHENVLSLKYGIFVENSVYIRKAFHTAICLCYKDEFKTFEGENVHSDMTVHMKMVDFLFKMCNIFSCYILIKKYKKRSLVKIFKNIE